MVSTYAPHYCDFILFHWFCLINILNILLVFVQNWHQTHSVRPPGMSQPPTEPRFEELPADTNQEAVSTADGVSNDNKEEVDTETDNGADQQNGKAQEGEISGQNNGIKQDVKD